MTLPRLTATLALRLATHALRSLFRPIPLPFHQWVRTMPANDDHDRDHQGEGRHRYASGRNAPGPATPPALTEADFINAESWGFLSIPEGIPVPPRWVDSCRWADRAVVVLHLPSDPSAPARLTAEWSKCRWGVSRAEYADAEAATESKVLSVGSDNIRAQDIPAHRSRIAAWRVAEVLAGARERGRARVGVGQ